jgi:ribokinase
MGPRTVVVTLGSHGSLLLETEAQLVPAMRITAVDTVGAGDAFNGTLAVALSQKSIPMLQCVHWANAAAALAVTRPGAQSALPYRAEIDDAVQMRDHQLPEN